MHGVQNIFSDSHDGTWRCRRTDKTLILSICSGFYMDLKKKGSPLISPCAPINIPAPASPVTHRDHWQGEIFMCVMLVAVNVALSGDEERAPGVWISRSSVGSHKRLYATYFAPRTCKRTLMGGIRGVPLLTTNQYVDHPSVPTTSIHIRRK